MADSLPTIDAARHEIARDATFEVHALANMLRAVIEQRCSDGEVAAAARGILTRIADLSDIVYEAMLCEDSERQDALTLSRKLGVRPAAA